MTTARFEEDNNTYKMTIREHAGYRPGCDIVCAGISAIAYTLAGYLHNRKDVEIWEETMESGYVSLFCRGGVPAAEAFRAAWIGLLQIAKEYPAHLTVYPSANAEKD